MLILKERHIEIIVLNRAELKKMAPRSQEESISTEIAVEGEDEIFPATVNFRM